MLETGIDEMRTESFIPLGALAPPDQAQQSPPGHRRSSFFLRCDPHSSPGPLLLLLLQSRQTSRCSGSSTDLAARDQTCRS